MGDCYEGSVWRRWDLHVHSPASHVQKYGSDEQAWDRFLDDLEALPESFAVIGINDYLFIDGYRQVLEAKAEGRVQNIDTVLPVVELRLSRLAGNHRLSRVNYHLIFSESLDPDALESQFLVQLRGNTQLSPEHAGVRWNGYVNRESIAELGAEIRRTIPPEELPRFDESDFELGMNNINFEPDKLTEILEAGRGLEGSYLRAIGKAEWEEFRWNDGSIAEKKHLINAADAVFVAAEDATAFNRARDRLIEQQVNSKLLDCSDAHDYSDSEDKDRIGNCLLWIKADATFVGLQAALQDYDDRVFVGDEPPVFERMRTSPRRFIRAVAFARTPLSGSDETWFEGQSLTMNPELTAIIGNRGSGKSALLDCIAFAAHSTYPVASTSFLSRFRNAKDGKAADFSVRLEWRGGDPTVACLAEDQDPNASPMVKHLPQHFIDQLCNERGEDFARELEQAIFSHVREDERQGASTLRELVAKRAHEVEVATEDLRVRLAKANQEIAQLEAMCHPDNVQQLRSRMEQLRQEVSSLVQGREPYPAKPPSPTGQESAQLAALKDELREVSDRLTSETAGRIENRKSIESARRVRSQVRLVIQRVDEIKVDCQDDLDALGLGFEDIVDLKTDFSELERVEADLEVERARLEALLDEDDESALPKTKARLASAVDQFTLGMTEPQQQYEAAVQEHADLLKRLRDLIGDSDQPDTIRGLQANLAYIEGTLAEDLAEKRGRRIEKAGRLYAEQKKLVAIFEELYGPVQSFVDKYRGTEGSLEVAFEARLADGGFDRLFFDEYITRSRKGTFCGAAEGTEQLTSLLAGVDWNSWESVKLFLTEMIDCLSVDRRSSCAGEQRFIGDQLKCEDPANFYGYLFGLEYLRPEYLITLNGRPLSELSSGEKGALLLVFYLLVDKSEVPLLIDQPEENLDNQSVYSVLRPFIREARSRRQVILVTHNPNIAVAAGADQVIYCSIDKAAGFQVDYEAGAIENAGISKRIVDVLEGTMPAFQRRERTYELTAS